MHFFFFFFPFFFNATATTEIYTLSLHDALPIWAFLFHALSIALSGAILYFFSSWILAAVPGALGYFAIIGISPFFVGLAGVSANRLRGLGWIGFVLGLLAGALVGSGVLA